MCYKQEREKLDGIKNNEKIKNYPYFLQDYFIRLPSNSTKNTNFYYIDHLLKWLWSQDIIDKKSIHDITPEDIDSVRDTHIIKYLDGLETGAYGTINSISSIITKKNIFSSLWEYLSDNDYVKKNVIRKIPKQKYRDERESKVKIPSSIEISDFMTKIYYKKNEFLRTRNIAIVAILAGTGMRAEELIGIDNIVLNEEQAYVSTMRKGDRRTEKSIEIRQEAIKYVLPYVKMRSKIETDSTALFLSKENTRISTTALRNIFSRNSDTIHPHMMRHIYASDMYAITKDLVSVQKSLNHKSYDTTSNMYVSVEHDKDFFIVLKEVDKEYTELHSK